MIHFISNEHLYMSDSQGRRSTSGTIRLVLGWQAQEPAEGFVECLWAAEQNEHAGDQTEQHIAEGDGDGHAQEGWPDRRALNLQCQLRQND